MDDINAIFRRVRRLQRDVRHESKDEQARVLILASIGEGLDTPARAVGGLRRLGYNDMHSYIVLDQREGKDWRTVDGKLVALT